MFDSVKLTMFGHGPGQTAGKMITRSFGTLKAAGSFALAQRPSAIYQLHIKVGKRKGGVSHNNPGFVGGATGLKRSAIPTGTAYKPAMKMVLGALGKPMRSAAPKPKRSTGTVRVKAHVATIRGKRVRVKAHTRKRR